HLLEPGTNLAPDGSYTFSGLANSNAQIRLKLPPKMSQTSPLIGNTFTETSSDIAVRPEGTAVGDFDHQHGDDLAVTMSNADQVWIYANNGSGTFSVIQKLTTGSHPGNVATADLNNDGWSDLIVSNAFDGTISIFINRNNSS